jgi:hypothetical protein
MRSILSFAVAIGLIAVAPLYSDGGKGPANAGVVVAVSGKAEVFAAGSDQSQALKLGGTLHVGDRIKTGANGQVRATLLDGTRLNISYNTDITLKDKNSKGKGSARGIASIKIALGELWAKVTKKDSQLEFETPDAVAAVKGTEPGFVVQDGVDAVTCIYLLSGAMQLSNAGGKADMTPMTQACLSAKTKLTQALVQTWDGKNAPKDGGSSASQATVQLQYKNNDGIVKSVELDYSK